MSCSYHTLVLKQDESYVLPPGATLVGATDPTLLTSQNDCLADDLANLESINCYIAAIAAMDNNNGNSEYGETIGTGGNPLKCKGIYSNGLYIPFLTGDIVGSSDGCFPGGTIGSKIYDLNIGVIGFAGGSNTHTSPDDNCLTYVLIQTIPSVADQLYLWMGQSAPLNSGNEYQEYVIPFKEYSYYSGNGYEQLPACSLV